MSAFKGSPVVLLSDTHCQEAPQGIQQSEVTRTRPGTSSLRGPSQNLPGTSRNRSNPAMIGNSSLGEHPKPPQVPQRQPRSSLDATASCLSHTTLVTSDDAQCRIPRELKSPKSHSPTTSRLSLSLSRGAYLPHAHDATPMRSQSVSSVPFIDVKPPDTTLL